MNVVLSLLQSKWEMFSTKSSRKQCIGCIMQWCSERHNYIKWIVYLKFGHIGFPCIVIGCTNMYIVRKQFSQWMCRLHPQSNMVTWGQPSEYQISRCLMTYKLVTSFSWRLSFFKGSLYPTLNWLSYISIGTSKWLYCGRSSRPRFTLVDHLQ